MFVAAAGMTAGLLGAALPASAATHGVGPVTLHTVSHTYDKNKGDKGGHGDKGQGDKGHGDTYRLDVRHTPYREPYKLVKVHNPGHTPKPCDTKKPKHHGEAPSYRDEHKRHCDPKPRDTRTLHVA